MNSKKSEFSPEAGAEASGENSEFRIQKILNFEFSPEAGAEASGENSEFFPASGENSEAGAEGWSFRREFKISKNSEFRILS